MGDTADDSSDVLQKIFGLHARIAERALEGETIHLVMEGKNDAPSIRVLHFDVAALAMNLHEADALQSRQDLSSRKQGQLHRVRATTSWDSSCRKSCEDGSR